MFGKQRRNKLQVGSREKSAASAKTDKRSEKFFSLKTMDFQFLPFFLLFIESTNREKKKRARWKFRSLLFSFTVNEKERFFEFLYFLDRIERGNVNIASSRRKRFSNNTEFTREISKWWCLPIKLAGRWWWWWGQGIPFFFPSKGIQLAWFSGPRVKWIPVMVYGDGTVQVFPWRRNGSKQIIQRLVSNDSTKALPVARHTFESTSRRGWWWNDGVSLPCGLLIV